MTQPSAFSLAGAILAVALATLPPCPASAASPAIGPQYDTTHVYVAPDQVDQFVRSFTATFGGQSTRQAVVTVTPTPSSTTSQLVQTPAGTVSLFAFKTPIPYPFGAERTGYLVRDMDKAIAAARAAGADVQVAAFPDPLGQDAVIQWPGGVNMQLYWHTAPTNYPVLQTIPDNRVYVSPDRADQFIRAFLAFSKGRVTSDDKRAAGERIGKPGTTFRRIAITSDFGRMVVLVTDGQLPFPYGRETTGYEAVDLPATLDKAKASGAEVLVPPPATGPSAAMVAFPGGYVAEIHAGPAH